MEQEVEVIHGYSDGVSIQTPPIGVTRAGEEAPRIDVDSEGVQSYVLIGGAKEVAQFLENRAEYQFGISDTKRSQDGRVRVAISDYVPAERFPVRQHAFKVLQTLATGGVDFSSLTALQFHLALNGFDIKNLPENLSHSAANGRRFRINSDKYQGELLLDFSSSESTKKTLASLGTNAAELQTLSKELERFKRLYKNLRTSERHGIFVRAIQQRSEVSGRINQSLRESDVLKPVSRYLTSKGGPQIRVEIEPYSDENSPMRQVYVGNSSTMHFGDVAKLIRSRVLNEKVSERQIQGFLDSQLTPETPKPTGFLGRMLDRVLPRIAEGEDTFSVTTDSSSEVSLAELSDVSTPSTVSYREGTPLIEGKGVATEEEDFSRLTRPSNAPRTTSSIDSQETRHTVESETSEIGIEVFSGRHLKEILPTSDVVDLLDMMCRRAEEYVDLDDKMEIQPFSGRHLKEVLPRGEFMELLDMMGRRPEEYIDLDEDLEESESETESVDYQEELSDSEIEQATIEQLASDYEQNMSSQFSRNYTEAFKQSFDVSFQERIATEFADKSPDEIEKIYQAEFKKQLKAKFKKDYREKFKERYDAKLREDCKVSFRESFEKVLARENKMSSMSNIKQNLSEALAPDVEGPLKKRYHAEFNLYVDNVRNRRDVKEAFENAFENAFEIEYAREFSPKPHQIATTPSVIAMASLLEEAKSTGAHDLVTEKGVAKYILTKQHQEKGIEPPTEQQVNELLDSFNKNKSVVRVIAAIKELSASTERFSNDRKALYAITDSLTKLESKVQQYVQTTDPEVRSNLEKEIKQDSLGLINQISDVKNKQLQEEGRAIYPIMGEAFMNKLFDSQKSDHELQIAIQEFKGVEDIDNTRLRGTIGPGDIDKYMVDRFMNLLNENNGLEANGSIKPGVAKLLRRDMRLSPEAYNVLHKIAVATLEIQKYSKSTEVADDYKNRADCVKEVSKKLNGNSQVTRIPVDIITKAMNHLQRSTNREKNPLLYKVVHNIKSRQQQGVKQGR